MLEKLTCAVRECTRDAYCKGYCEAHYKRWRTNGDPGSAEIQSRGRKGCSAEGCENPHSCRGYCEKHYRRFREKGVVDDASFQPYARTGCSVPDCGNPHFKRGFCMKHEWRMRRRGTTDDLPATCTVGDCGRRCYSRGKYAGLCEKHAERLRLHGSTDNPLPSLEERFLAKAIRSENGCWGWNGTVDDQGYAKINVSRKPVGAHIVSYGLWVGAVPDGAHVDHVCHSRDMECPGGPECAHRRCSNPAHLEAVTPKENAVRSGANRRAAAGKVRLLPFAD